MPTAAICMENENNEQCLSFFVDRGEAKLFVTVYVFKYSAQVYG
jgi:hypothetical protein